MPEINRITLPSGDSYDLQDAVARESIPTKTSDLDNDEFFVSAGFENTTLVLGMAGDIEWDSSIFEESVSGTTVTINAQPNMTYYCGEVDTLTIVPPSAGTVDIWFTSPDTIPTALYANGVIFPDWFDPDNLDTSTRYEIIISNGTYGGVSKWSIETTS